MLIYFKRKNISLESEQDFKYVWLDYKSCHRQLKFPGLQEVMAAVYVCFKCSPDLELEGLKSSLHLLNKWRLALSIRLHC